MPFSVTALPQHGIARSAYALLARAAAARLLQLGLMVAVAGLAIVVAAFAGIGGQAFGIGRAAANRSASLTGSKVAEVLQLAFLSPELVERIVRGTQPKVLSTAQLVRDEEVPAQWNEQRVAFATQSN